MAEKKTRIQTSGPAQSLTANPFSSLNAIPADSLAANPVAAPQPDAAASAPKLPPFRIARTKKGGYPTAMERRSAGKSVTIIRNVSGDTDALLTLLKKHCAAGGKAFEDSVEIQGEHSSKVEAFLREKGF